MTDIRLDDTGDIWWENGLIDTVTGEDEKLQQLTLALETGLAEWAFDTEAGMPYRASTQSRAGNEALLEGRAREIAEERLGPDSVKVLKATRDPALRKLTIYMDTVYGELTVTI